MAMAGLLYGLSAHNQILLKVPGNLQSICAAFEELVNGVSRRTIHINLSVRHPQCKGITYSK
jgi:hypothetical protein